MTHNSNSDFLESDQRGTPEGPHEESGSFAATTHSTQCLTLHLSLESKRKAHALAVVSNRSIAQVIEELIENCPESTSLGLESFSIPQAQLNPQNPTT
jgi:hypothetical protein